MSRNFEENFLIILNRLMFFQFILIKIAEVATLHLILLGFLRHGQESLNKIERGSRLSPLPPGALFNATCFWLSLVRFPPQDILTPFHQNSIIPIDFFPAFWLPSILARDNSPYLSF